VPGLAQQLADRLAKVIEVMAPVARRPTISSGNVGVAVDRSVAERNCQQTASRRQSCVPGLILGEAASDSSFRYRL
jgi:hypothetical protein